MHIRYYNWLLKFSGYKRSCLAIALGGLSATAFAPTYLIIMMILGFTSLIWLVNSATNNRRVILDIFFFSFGQYLIGFYWISISMLTDPAKFGWMIPFSVTLLPLGLSILFALPVGIAMNFYRRYSRNIITTSLMFAVFWSLAEVVRTYIFSGFPWNLTGYVWTFSSITMQNASIWGIWGLSLITLIICCLPAALIEKKFRPLVIAGALVAGIMLYGMIRIPTQPTEFAEGSKVRIVQGNISQDKKWQEDLRIPNLQTYMQLTNSAGLEGITHIIWPESAIPFIIFPESPIINYIKSAFLNGQYLISGTMRVDDPTIPNYKIWNSLHVFSKNGIETSYDKVRLVPFGEYVPLRGVLPIEKITPGTKDFTNGTQAMTIKIPNLPAFSPLICYEAIYPVGIYDNNNPPEAFITVTNDAWFGVSTGPFQHLQMARMRAVEYGIPILRAANTGISAVFDPYGRVVKVLPLNQQGVIDSGVPKAIPDRTFYAKNQYIGYISLLILVIISALYIMRRGLTIAHQ